MSDPGRTEGLGEDVTVDGSLATLPAAPEAPAADPGRIGRHIVLGSLGAGGMGVVYSAYDPDLERKIAIKLIRSDEGDAADPDQARARLTREAQAMAKLSHPNVIHVYDVGTHDGQVYIAMELVDGHTLRTWMEQPRPWREVLDVFVRAGRGLAAAHDRGLVHCDFKPENVLLGVDGRVRVVDFGLARAADLPPGSTPAEAPEHDAEPPLDAHAAKTQGIRGTPAYMAPEQMEGKATDARSDQFAFCIALHEALYGARPFAGDTIASLTYAVLEGRVREAPASSDVPAWVRRVVLRGLAVRPEDRYPSMAVLLDELGRDPTRARRRWLLGGALAAVIGTAGWAAYAAQQAREMTCQGAERNLDGVWDPQRKAEVRAAFEATALPFAAATFAWVERRLDEHASDWVAMHTDACEATHVRGEQSGELLDLRMACLRNRLRDLDALAGVLADADHGVVRNAVDTVGALSSLAPCADAEALRAELPPPRDPATASAVETARAELARARVLQESGMHVEGLALAREVSASAAELGYAPLAVEADRRLGTLEEKTGDYAAAEASLSRAYFGALAIGHDRELAEAGASLVVVVGLRQARHGDGLTWGRHADAAIERIGRGGVEEARLLNNLAAVRSATGERDQALGMQHRALEIYEATLEPDHPTLASSLNNLGILLNDAGEHASAREMLERARTIWERALGPDNPEVAASYNNLGMTFESEGRLDEAGSHYERALAIKEAALGADHPDVSMLVNNLGLLAEKQGRYPEARRHYERALAIKRKTLDPNHPSVAISINNLGGLLNLTGDHAEALAQYGAALAIFEGALGRDHPFVAYALTGIGTAHVGLGAPARALEPLERALKLRLEKNAAPTDVGETRFVLARALWDSRRDRRRAVELARRARDDFRSGKDAGVAGVAEIDAWLAKHGG